MRTSQHQPGPKKVGGCTLTLPLGKPCGRTSDGAYAPPPYLRKGPAAVQTEAYSSPAPRSQQVKCPTAREVTLYF